MKSALPLLFTALLGLGASTVRAQSVGIGTMAPDPSAALEIASSNKGALLPRLLQAQRETLPTPATGLIVYQSDGTGASGPGFYYNAGTVAAPKWLRLTDADGVRFDPATGLQVGPGPVSAERTFTVGSAAGNTNVVYAAASPDHRVQVIYLASELQAAGLRAGLLTSLEMEMLLKRSTQPFAGLTIALGHTTLTSFASIGVPFLSGLTTVYTAPAPGYTTREGWNVHPFSTPFAWDGTSNLVVQVCYSNAAGSSESVGSYPTGRFAVAYAQSGLNAPQGCDLPTVQLRAGAAPVVRFTQAGGAYTLPPQAGSAGQTLVLQASGALTFQTAPWTQAGTNVVTAVPGSAVGIGTNTPTGRLTIETPSPATSSADDLVLRGLGAGSSPALAVQRARTASNGSPLVLENGDLIGSLSFEPRLTTGYAPVSGVQSHYRSNGTAPNSDLQLLTSGTSRVTIDDEGNVGVGTTSPGARLDVADGDVRVAADRAYTYAGAQERKLVVTPFDFIAPNPSASDRRVAFGSGGGRAYGVYPTGTGGQQLLAPVRLPQGAVITSIELRAIDNDNSSTTPTRVRLTSIQTSAGVGIVASSSGYATLANNAGTIQAASTTVSNFNVDNDNYYYYLEYSSNASSSCVLMGVVVTYTVTAAE